MCTNADARAAVSASHPMSRPIHVADAGGVPRATIAALCGEGTPFMVSARAAAGVSLLRKDADLWPLMFGALHAARRAAARVHARDDVSLPGGRSATLSRATAGHSSAACD